MLNSFSLLLINFCEVPCEFCNSCLHLACQQVLPPACLKEIPDAAAAPDTARSLWNTFNDFLKAGGVTVRKGEFGAHMEVSLVNDGPVTFVLESK